MDFLFGMCYITVMKIGVFSQRTGLSVLTVRYYMDIGLLFPKKKERHWDFTQSDLDRAEKIERCKQCGFSLQTIGELLRLEQADSLSPEEREQQFRQIFDNEYERVQSARQGIEGSLERLGAMIRAVKGQVITELFNGIPLALFALIQCPYCDSSLSWNKICVEHNQVVSGLGACRCGFRAAITDGILVVEAAGPPLIPAVDKRLATLQQRKPQDVSYLETFNHWLHLHLAQLDMDGKVIFEDVLNTACFLNRSMPQLSENAFYILCDTDIRIVRYYMSSIRAAHPERKMLFLVDDGIHHPLEPGCLDIIIDYAASEIYQKYGYRSTSTPLKRYAHKGTVVAGRFSRLCKKQPGERDPRESNPIRYQLSVLQQDMQNNGLHIFAEKIGAKAVDPSVYIGALPGDIFKPYAFIGRWLME